MKPIYKDIAAGVIGAVILAIFLFIINAGILISVGAGILAYIGSVFLFATKKKQTVIMVAEGVTKEDFARTLSEGRTKVAAIVAAGKAIENLTVQSQVQDICTLSAKIFDDLERDPKGVKKARKFLNYYLDTTQYIVNRYAELSKDVGYSNEVKQMLAKVEQTLTLLQETFKKQIEHLLQDDVDDLDIELELLEKTIKTEGIR